MTKKFAKQNFEPEEDFELETDSYEDDGEEDYDENDEGNSDFDDEPVSDIEEDDNFEQEDFNGNAEDDQAFAEEDDSQQMDDNEEPQQEKATAKVIEVDSKQLEQLSKNISKGNIGSIRTIIKIFNSVFSDKKSIATASIYNVRTSKLLNRLIQIFLEDCPNQVSALPTSKKNQITTMTYLKAIYEYLSKLENEAVASLFLTRLKVIYPLYLKFKTLNKKLIKEVIDLWGKSQLFSTKFHSYILIKTMTDQSDNENKKLIFQKLLAAYLKYASNLTWRTYTNFAFMRNCVADSVSLSIEIAYVVLFDKLKEMAAKVLDISKNKVT